MKTTIEIDIDEELLRKVNSYALNHNTSFSEIVENYLIQLSKKEKVTKPKKRKNILVTAALSLKSPSNSRLARQTPLNL